MVTLEFVRSGASGDASIEVEGPVIFDLDGIEDGAMRVVAIIRMNEDGQPEYSPDPGADVDDDSAWYDVLVVRHDGDLD